MGVNGLYFRQTIPTENRNTAFPNEPPVPNSPDSDMKEIESASVLCMKDSSSSELLKEINDKYKKMSLFPIAIVLSIICLILVAAATMPLWLKTALLSLCLVGAISARYRDKLAKTTVILYDMDSATEESYKKLYETFEILRACKRVWHVEASGRVKDRKYHAGASKLLQRTVISLNYDSLPLIKTNVQIPVISVGRQKLALFPDRVLVAESSAVGAIPYSSLEINLSTTRFIEDGSVPSDSKIVDYTWQYVNKSGGPDRRFKNNRRLPIALYEELHFNSSSGLNELIQLSKTDVSSAFKGSIIKMSSLSLTEQNPNDTNAV
jgi:hypothetical protein